MPKHNPSRRCFLTYGAAAVATCIAGSYPLFIERTTVLVNHYRIVVARLPKLFEGFTIVHLTDLHYGLLSSLAFIRSIVERANAIPRDITVCTGDYIHERDGHAQIDAVWPVLGKLNAPQGVYSVLGNHDYWADGARSLFWLERSGQSLHHKTHRFERGNEALWLAGAGDMWEDHTEIGALTRHIPHNECRIVLTHNPDTADTSLSSRADLFVAGHTHGGQVKIPFFGAPVLPVSNKAYTSGLKHSRKGDPVFISRGIGCAVYPVRFNCYPEIAVLRLTRADERNRGI
jgi:uncharacterized protein